MIKYKDFPGEFVKPCPCSPETVECGYYNLNLHTGCPFACSYCILQSYLETRSPVYYTNLEEMEKQLSEASLNIKELRIGTGELSDSLAWDNETSYSEKLLKIFSSYPDIVFEFKTKSSVVQNLLKAKSNPSNIVVSWSLNPQSIVSREEPYTALIKERLAAMEMIQKKGYKIGIHFDPLIITEGWKELYDGLIEEIRGVLNPNSLAWWSIGALRFPASLKKHIFQHQDSRLFDGELIKGFDNKFRYFRPLRRELFSYISQSIRRKISSSVPLYLCMEDVEMWEDILPEIEPEKESVNRYLYNTALNK